MSQVPQIFRLTRKIKNEFEVCRGHLGHLFSKSIRDKWGLGVFWTAYTPLIPNSL